MAILDWIYPKKCLGCGALGRYVCEECQKGIERRGESLKYTGIVRKIIKQVKYRGSYDLVHELVGLWTPKRPQGLVIVTSVPMWEGKKRVRGYNQAELIAREVARLWSVEYRELLTRNRETKPMYGLDKQARLANISGAFEVKSQAITNKKTIVLIDDVWTSGATMQECTRVLKRAGWEGVIPMALAS